MGAGDSDRFRILSLEGGGIMGAFSASALATLEETTGYRCAEYFDLIAGTSTGGIIAIGLGLGLSARDICDFYVEHGAQIFPHTGFGKICLGSGDIWCARSTLKKFYVRLSQASLTLKRANPVDSAKAASAW